jgi:F-type H+-transporting ATPase subunit epsilon
MSKLILEITTPEKTVFQSEVDGVTVPTAEGEITVLPNHAPLVGLVVPGALTIHGEKESYMAVSGGALQILPIRQAQGVAGTRCVILTDSADRAEDLIEAEIEKARARAQAAYEEAKDKDQVAYADASISLERELARLNVARKHRRSHGHTLET